MRLRCGFMGCGDVFSRPFLEALQKWGVLAGEGAPADLGVIASHGKVLTPEELARFPRGVVNMHPSLLPLYRGAAPAEARWWNSLCSLLLVCPFFQQWQLLDGVTHSGITALLTTPRVDAGPVLAQEAFPVTEETTRDELLREAAARGVAMLERLLSDWDGAVAAARPQEAGGPRRRAPKVDREMSRVDWSGWTVRDMVRRQRALGERFGGLECRFGEKAVKLTGQFRADGSGPAGAGEVGRSEMAWREGALRVRMRDGWVRVPSIVVAGGKAPMDAASFYRGYLLRDPSKRFS